MYHIKNDRRCLRSAESIVRALESLLEKKAFMNITVTDVHKTAGVGRSTFYRLFDTIDDVVIYRVDEYFKTVVKNYTKLNMRDFTLACLAAITESGGAIENVMMSGRSDLVSRSLRKNLHAAVRESGDPMETEIQYRFAVFASTCMSVIKVWDENGRKESLEELADYVEKYLDFSSFSLA